MWQCRKCNETVDAEFAVCWNCGTSKEGVEDPDFDWVDDAPTHDDIDVPPERPQRDPIMCPRCLRALEFMGTKKFHEGTRWGAIGDLGELFVNKERFDVYCCPRCGRVEFFVDGIGEEFRPQ